MTNRHVERLAAKSAARDIVEAESFGATVATEVVARYEKPNLIAIHGASWGFGYPKLPEDLQ